MTVKRSKVVEEAFRRTCITTCLKASREGRPIKVELYNAAIEPIIAIPDTVDNTYFNYVVEGSTGTILFKDIERIGWAPVPWRADFVDDWSYNYDKKTDADLTPFLPGVEEVAAAFADLQTAQQALIDIDTENERRDFSAQWNATDYNRSQRENVRRAMNAYVVALAMATAQVKV